MTRFSPKIVYVFALLGSFAHADPGYDRYYYRHGHQLDAEIEYSQKAFADMKEAMTWSSEQITPLRAPNISEANLKQIVKIENEMARIVGLRAFIPPINCVVDCNDATDAIAKIGALNTAIDNTEWHYYAYDELGLLLAQAQGLKKLSFTVPKVAEATLLQICSFDHMGGDFPHTHIFTKASLFLSGRNYKAVRRNLVTFVARFDNAGPEVQGTCAKDEDGDTHIKVGDYFDAKTDSHEWTEGYLKFSSPWSGTYKGQSITFVR